SCIFRIRLDSARANRPASDERARDAPETNGKISVHGTRGGRPLSIQRIDTGRRLAVTSAAADHLPEETAVRTRKFAALLLCVLAFLPPAFAWPQALPPAPAESVGMSAQRLGRIGEAYKHEIDQGKLPGVVVMVARKGKLVYADAIGFQNKEAGKPMTADAIFRIYSMTKPLVSVAAMMLVEDGTLQLTDPVGKFLPGFDKMQVSVATKTPEGQAYANVPAERAMTVQDLLRHTSGLAYGEITQNAPVKEGLERAGLYRKDIDFEARGATPKEEVERLASVPLAYQPGTTWNYSLSTDVLGRVVEAASGKRLSEFLDERLFKPLKMRDNAFYVPAAKSARL